MHIALGPFEQASAADFIGIAHLTHDELEEIRDKCDRRAGVVKAGEASVKLAGEKAEEAAECAAG